MRRGEVRWVDFEPSRGSETNKLRPAVVVSNDGANTAVERTGRGVVTVVPLTSNVHRVRPFQVLIEAGVGGVQRDSKAQCEQVRAVTVEMVGALIGRLPLPIVGRIDEALRVQLDL